MIVVRLVADIDEVLQAADGLGVQTCRHPCHQRLVGLAERRSHDLGDPIHARRLDELPPAPGEQILPDPVFPTLGFGDVPGEPEGQLLGVGHAALPEARVAADLGTVALGRTAGHVVGAELGRCHAHLAGDVVHGVVGQLVAAPGEPAPPEQELERQGEAETCRSGFVAELVHLVAHEGEVVDHLVQAQVPRHHRPLLGEPAVRRGRHPNVTGNTIFPVTWPPPAMASRVCDLR